MSHFIRWTVAESKNGNIPFFHSIFQNPLRNNYELFSRVVPSMQMTYCFIPAPIERSPKWRKTSPDRRLSLKDECTLTTKKYCFHDWQLFFNRPFLVIVYLTEIEIVVYVYKCPTNQLLYEETKEYGWTFWYKHDLSNVHPDNTSLVN